jgi:hypothetical protein
VGPALRLTATSPRNIILETGVRAALVRAQQGAPIQADRFACSRRIIHATRGAQKKSKTQSAPAEIFFRGGRPHRPKPPFFPEAAARRRALDLRVGL